MWSLFFISLGIFIGRFWGKHSYQMNIPKKEIWGSLDNAFLWTNLPPGGYFVLHQTMHIDNKHIVLAQYAKENERPSDNLIIFSLPRQVPKIFRVRKVTRSHGSIESDLFRSVTWQA